MRVFIDASVLIAALISPTGGSSLLLKYAAAGKVTGIISQTVIDEILKEDKFTKIKKTKIQIEQFIAQSSLIIRKPITVEEIKPYQDLIDIEDAHLVAGANLTKCQYLATLDKKHVLRPDVQKKFLPLKIVSPGQLLEEIVR